MDTPKELEFPVDWTFRIIAVAEDGECRGKILETFERFGMRPGLSEGLRSSSGKYRTLIAPVRLDSRRTFDELPKALAEIPGVKTVL